MSITKTQKMLKATSAKMWQQCLLVVSLLLLRRGFVPRPQQYLWSYELLLTAKSTPVFVHLHMTEIFTTTKTLVQKNLQPLPCNVGSECNSSLWKHFTPHGRCSAIYKQGIKLLTVTTHWTPPPRFSALQKIFVRKTVIQKCKIWGWRTHFGKI